MRKAAGFSLVEVLIAAAILAVALLAIASMFPIAHTNVDWSGDQTVAVTLAQQRIEWLRNQTYTSAALADGTTTENLTGTYVGFTRTTVIEDDPPALGVAGIKQVTVTVAAPSGKSVGLVTVVTQ